MPDDTDLSLEEILKRPPPKPTFPEQNADGIDLSLIRENLKLTPTERVRQGDRARRDTLRLLEIGRRNREKQARAAR